MTFAVFGVSHLLTILGLIAAIAALCVIGRRLAARPRAQRRYERALAIAVALLWVGYQAYDAVRNGFDVRYSLPLQLCDLAALVAALSFASPHRAFQSLSWFWGLALSTQALVTPDLAGGPGTLAFWAFWLYHLFVVGAGVYVVAVRGFRPQWQDVRLAISLGVLYAAVIFTVDAFFDLNYGYLGRARPGVPSLIDVLGPWPLRVVAVVSLGAAAMLLLWAPFELLRRRRGPAT